MVQHCTIRALSWLCWYSRVLKYIRGGYRAACYRSAPDAVLVLVYLSPLLIELISWVFRRTWTDAEEPLKEKSFFILSFVFLSEFVIRQVQTNIY